MMLTPDPAPRAERALAAAQAKAQSGAFDAALDLLAVAEAGPLGELGQARVDLVRAQLAFAASRGSDAPPLLLRAAERLEPIDAELARATYLDAMTAALFAGRLATRGGSLLDVARAASVAPPPSHTPSAGDLLLDGLAANFNHGYAAGVPILRTALGAFSTDMPADQELRWLPMACRAALHLWDHDQYQRLTDRHAELCRETGALSELPLALMCRVHVLLPTGDLTAAASAVAEMQAVVEATGSNLARYGAMSVAAFRGKDSETSALIQATLRDVSVRGEGLGITAAEWANALLNNGLGRYQDCLLYTSPSPRDLSTSRMPSSA